MQIRLSSLIATAAMGYLAFGLTTSAMAASANGKWSWTTPARGGGEPRKTTLTLKVEGSKLTGTVAAPGRQGAAARETEISDGKVSGDDISFSVVREFNGNKMTTKYSGKVSADAIKGKVETERNGQPVSRDWEAKKEK